MLDKIMLYGSAMIIITLVIINIYKYLKKKMPQIVNQYQNTNKKSKIITKIKNIIYNKIIFKISRIYTNYLYKKKLREFLNLVIRMTDTQNIYNYRTWNITEIENVYGKEFTKAYNGYISYREEGDSRAAKKYWVDQFRNNKLAKDIINYIDQIAYQNQDIEKVKEILIELSNQEEKLENIELEKKLAGFYYMQYTLSILIIFILIFVFISGLFNSISSINLF